MQRTTARLAPDSTTPAKRFVSPRNGLEQTHAVMLAVLQSGAAFREALASLLAVRGPLTSDRGEDLRVAVSAAHYATGLLVDDLASEMPGAPVCVFWGVRRGWSGESASADAADVHPDATV